MARNIRDQEVREIPTVRPAMIDRSRSDEDKDNFAFPKELIPDGFEYEWKRYEIRGMPEDMYQADLYRHGWLPVPAERHPQIFGPMAKGVARNGDQILMERPTEYSEDARRFEARKADSVVMNQTKKLGVPTNQLMPQYKKNFNTVRQATELQMPIDDSPVGE